VSTTERVDAPPQDPIFTRSGALSGARQGLPLAASVFLVGTVFGVLARHAGLTLVETLLMSALVFAGASQFVAVGLWAFPIPIAAIVLTTLIVNLRHVLLSAALRPWFRDLSRLRVYGSLFFMVDESWALTMGQVRAGARDRAFLIGAGSLMYLSWVSSTGAGYLAGSALGDLSRRGLDFAITAIFTALLIGMWRGRSDLWPWLVSAGVALITWHLLPGTWYIVCGALSGTVTGAVLDDE
jgi:4-azaleucine resistance transporter AzlC